MHVSSINSFAASWLLLFVISPLHSAAERMTWVPYEVNDLVRHQFQPIQSEVFPFDERFKFNAPGIPRDIHQINSVESRTSQKDIFAKQNVAKFRPKYRTEDYKEYKPYYAEYIQKEGAARSAELEQRYEEARRKDEEIMKKMNVLDKLLSENSEENDIESKITVEDKLIAEMIPEETRRVVRQVRRERPGFFWTLARLAFETYNDTRSAIQQISNIVGQTFEPETSSTRAPASSNPLMVANVTTVAPGSDQNNMSSNMASVNVTTTMRPSTTTTQAPYRFTRNGLLQLLARNIRGLIRLFNIEWQDALNQSEINVREFQKDLGNQIGSYLRDNPDAF